MNRLPKTIILSLFPVRFLRMHCNHEFREGSAEVYHQHFVIKYKHRIIRNRIFSTLRGRNSRSRLFSRYSDISIVTRITETKRSYFYRNMTWRQSVEHSLRDAIFFFFHSIFFFPFRPPASVISLWRVCRYGFRVFSTISARKIILFYRVLFYFWHQWHSWHDGEFVLCKNYNKYST